HRVRGHRVARYGRPPRHRRRDRQTFRPGRVSRLRTRPAIARTAAPVRFLDVRPSMQTRTAATQRAVVAPRTPRTACLSVVLAEDDLEMRRLLAEALRRDGHEVIEAKNGSELLERLDSAATRQERIGLVITDVRMPGLTGLQALDWLQRVRAVQVPILVITAFCDPLVRHQAARLGAQVLEKPFELDELRARLRKLPLASD